MAITVRMDQTTEKLLERLSKKKQLNKSAIVREAIRCLAARESTSLYDRIADLIGSVDSGGANLSDDAHHLAANKIKKKHGRPR